MDVRKVQITGGSSFIITLPKDWIRSANIKKNDSLGLIQQPDGTLLISAKIIEKPQEGAKKFNTDTIREPTHLFRCLIGAYMSGYPKIIIKSKAKITPSQRAAIRDFTQMTVGQEVVEETDRSITIKDLLDPIEMPFESTIKRTHLIVRSMLEDSIRLIEKGESVLVEDIAIRERDVIRLNWLVSRQYSTLLRNVNLITKMGINTEIATHFFLISRLLRRIGDHSVQISRNALRIKDKKVDQKIISDIEEVSDQIIEIIDKCVESSFKRDLMESNKIIDQVKPIDKKCIMINTKLIKQKSSVAIPLHYITANLRRTATYVGDISIEVINHIIEQDLWRDVQQQTTYG